MTRAQADPVEGLAGLVRLRDGATARHADRVTTLTLAVARELGVGDDALGLLESAARVQDVAKIALPDRILHPHRPLTSAERTAVHRHADWVAGTLATMPGLETVAPIVRARHERWDGTGKPLGLAGEAIPLASRILAVCDGYCSLTRATSYRDAVPADRAAAAIESVAGKQFDPRVVAALLTVLAANPDGFMAPEDAARPARTGRFDRTGQSPASSSRPADGATTRLIGAFDATRLPALSETRRRILELVDPTQLPTATLTDLAELDPGMTAALLRAAGPQCSGVEEALQTLTFSELERLLDDVATTDFFAPLSVAQSVEQFRAHAVATRRAARRLAQLTNHEAPDRIAAAALLHDIGKVVLCLAVPSYAQTQVAGALAPAGSVREERRAFGLDHATAGAALLRRWGLHEDIVEAVAGHHDASENHDGALLSLADVLAHAGSGDAVDPRLMTDLAGGLGVSPEELRTILFELQPTGGQRPERPDPCPLSPKELSLVRSLSEGKRYKHIAEEHGISVSTVRSHFSNVYAKLSVTDRAQAVMLASTRGWL